MGISREKYANNDDNVVGSLARSLFVLNKHGVVCHKLCAVREKNAIKEDKH